MKRNNTINIKNSNIKGNISQVNSGVRCRHNFNANVVNYFGGDFGDDCETFINGNQFKVTETKGSVSMTTIGNTTKIKCTKRGMKVNDVYYDAKYLKFKNGKLVKQK